MFKPASILKASENDEIETVRALLEKDPNAVRKEDYENNTALLFASGEGRTPIVRLLLNAGANIHHANKYGITALHSAARWSKAETVRELIRQGANVHSLTAAEDTALLLAACFANAETVRALLDADAFTLIPGQLLHAGLFGE